MTNLDATEGQGGTVRVSIIERLVPTISYSIIAIAGAVAAMFLIFALQGIANSASSKGIGGVASDIAHASTALSAGFVLSLLAGFAAIVACGTMVFVKRTTASPSFLYLLVPGILSIVPAILAYPGIRMIVFAPFEQTDFQTVSGTLYPRLYAAIILGILAVIASLVVSFIPSRSTAGRKFSPLLLSIVFEIAIFIVACLFWWQMSDISKFAKMM